MRAFALRLGAALISGLPLAVPAAFVPGSLAAQEAGADMTTLVADMVRIDGEDVLVKKRGKAPRFEVRLLESTVKATRIGIDKE